MSKPRKSTFEIQQAAYRWLENIAVLSGEVSEDAEDQLEVILGDVEDKATALFYARQRTRTLQAEAKEMAEIAKVQKAKWRCHEMRIMGLLQNLLEAKEATGKEARIEGAWGTAHLRKTKSLEIEDEKAIGFEWQKSKEVWSIDTVAIKDALNANKEVPGCKMVSVITAAILSKK
tara:strand:- start:4027 stop:4551 length:525 start_codon:yes stop_codon:yes gene_type:complete